MGPTAIGAVCIMLEDIGFTFNDSDELIPMTYYYYVKELCNRVYADVNLIYTIEVMLDNGQITADRWKWEEENQLFLAEDCVEYDIHDPKSLIYISSFVEETLELD